MAISAGAGRSTRRYQRLRADLRAKRRPCCLCGEPIDYTLTNPDPQSFSVEHLKDLVNHPELAEDPANLDAAHLGCNSSHGQRARWTKVHTDRLGQRSRPW